MRRQACSIMKHEAATASRGVNRVFGAVPRILFFCGFDLPSLHSKERMFG